MLNSQAYKPYLPSQLYSQIEEVLSIFQQLHHDTADIVCNGRVPDASLQLHNVLASTEEATTTIIDTVTAIQSIADGAAPPEAAQQIGELVTKVYEACNFQDISGQRIKKVLGSLETLEQRLQGLADAMRVCLGDAAVAKAPEAQGDAALMQGPQLDSEAPKQDEIDKLFNSF